MRLQTLTATSLRNLHDVELTLAEGLTLLHGRNGQGKTAILEAVYVLGTGRSFRTRRLEEAVAWGQRSLRVCGTVETRTGQSRLEVSVESGQRRMLVGGAERDLENYLGRLDLVDLTAGRMMVLRGAPDERRRFLDRGLVALEPGFLRVLGDYRRTLQHRNALLRQPPARARPTLRAWNERLVLAARRIHERRRRFCEQLDRRTETVAAALLGPEAGLRLDYRPSPAAAIEAEPERFEEILGRALQSSEEKDFSLGHTTSGPHRDEVGVRLGNADLRRYGSAGQQRAAMIVLKLAKLALMSEERGEPPLFLMDDFDSDLDEARATALASFLRQGGFQALAATSKTELADRLPGPVHRVLVDAGRARPER